MTGSTGRDEATGPTAEDLAEPRVDPDRPSGTRIWQPSWTPDGRAIIADLEANRDGVLVDPSTGAVTVFASGDQPVTHPRLRPVP